jgi:hypothetical protein
VTKKDPEVVKIGKMTARTLFARTKVRTIKEVQKRLFEENHPFTFPYSLDRFKDSDLPPLTADDLLALDDPDWEMEEMDLDNSDEGEETEAEASGYDRDRADTDADEEGVTDIGTDDVGEIGIASGEEPTPNSKELSKLAFRFYQRAVSLAMSSLSLEEKTLYVQRARLSRVQGLSIADKRRYVRASHSILKNISPKFPKEC